MATGGVHHSAAAASRLFRAAPPAAPHTHLVVQSFLIDPSPITQPTSSNASTPAPAPHTPSPPPHTPHMAQACCARPAVGGVGLAVPRRVTHQPARRCTTVCSSLAMLAPVVTLAGWGGVAWMAAKLLTSQVGSDQIAPAVGVATLKLGPELCSWVGGNRGVAPITAPLA